MLVKNSAGKYEVKNGIDNLSGYSDLFRGKRLGLITNSAGFDKQMRSTVDILRTNYNLCKLFAPEHGISGNQQAGDCVDFGYDLRTGLPVYSLYGKDSHISSEIMSGLDAIVFDIQDVGVRYYTYLSLLLSVMEDCKHYNRELIVLDRINPLGGAAVEGNIPEIISQVCALKIPNRYGLTIGEIAGLANAEQDCRLHVVPLSGWQRNMLFEETDLLWINPSPNLPSPAASLIYTGTCLFEGTNISEGRGTSHPFELIGAPWLDPYSLAEEMNNLQLDGVIFRPVCFTPVSSKHSNAVCGGVQLHLTDQRKFHALEVGVLLLLAIKKSSGNQFEWVHSDNIGPRLFIDYLSGTPSLREKSDGGELYGIWSADATRFAKQKSRFHLYE